MNTELAQFLRTRRERLSPADVGLPHGARRRTPGLRREEVARLADVGVSWYTWLEQGRPVRASEPLLERLAKALALSPPERAHLFELAHGRPGPRPALFPTTVSPAIQRVLDSHPYPAIALTIRRDLLAWNTHATRLYGDFSEHPPEMRNLLWSLFMDPRKRTQFTDWSTKIRHAVAQFRFDAARAVDREPFDALARDLSAVSPEFAELWSTHDVSQTGDGKKRVALPEAGVVTFDHVTLVHLEPDGHEVHVTFYTPVPEDAAKADSLFRASRWSTPRKRSTSGRRAADQSRKVARRKQHQSR